VTIEYKTMPLCFRRCDENSSAWIWAGFRSRRRCSIRNERSLFRGVNMDELVLLLTVFSKNSDRLLSGDIAENLFA
jgi:hypothetical protein